MNKILQFIGPMASGKSTLVRNLFPGYLDISGIVMGYWWNYPMVEHDVWVIEECSYRRAEGRLNTWLTMQKVLIERPYAPSHWLDISNKTIIHIGPMAIPLPEDKTLVWGINKLDNWGQ